MSAWSVSKHHFVPLVCALLVVLTGVQTASSQVPDTVALLPGSTASADTTTCRPGSGWTWTAGPSRPEVAEQVQDTLSQMGIEASVEASSYGETDSCGAFSTFGIDFAVTVQSESRLGEMAQRGLADRINAVLTRFGKPSLGRARVTFLPGNTVLTLGPPISLPSKTAAQPFLASALDSSWYQATTGALPSGRYTHTQEYSGTIPLSHHTFLPVAMHAHESKQVFHRKVYVVVYDPLLSNGQNLSTYLGWYDHADLTQGTIDLFRQATDDRLTYSVVYTSIITDGWPVKADGFRYTEPEYLAVIAQQSPPHAPDGVDYNKIVNSPALDICGKANRGEIDEVWIYNGPYFGFWESTLVGPGAYWYNSPPVPGPHSCNRLIPIMGPSPERALDCAVHNFGHRTESTMTQVYGSWKQNRTAHGWDRFALVKALSPDYAYSGCGDVHYPPNGTSGYDYGNPAAALSNCDDFASYPRLGDPAETAKLVTCSDWECTHVGYFAYWFGHLPSNTGCDPDRVANDWWTYLASPALALNPSAPCPAGSSE